MDDVVLASPGSSPLSFTYDQLGTDTSVRLLHLAHVGPKATLSCTLQEFELAKCPTYVAVSYCWGASGSSQKIIINGVTATITTSLAAVLRQLQADAREDEYFVWADAICINQHAVHEKDTQIKLMPQIYSRALRVVAWLSRVDADMMDLRSIKMFVDAGLKMPDDPNKAKAIDSRLSRAFLALSKADYWRRIWVVQEVSLANDIEVTCGSVRVPWNQFFAALGEVLGERYASQNGVRQNMNIFVTSSSRRLNELDALRQRIRGRENLPLLQAMYWTRECESRRPRDKIFALVGLVTDSWQPSRALFYGHKLELVEKQITLYEMEGRSKLRAGSPLTVDSQHNDRGGGGSCSLDLITFSNITSHGDGGRKWLPSWTDRSLWARLRLWQYLHLDLPGDLRFQAMPRLNTMPERSEAGALRVRGYCLGTVSGHRDVGPWIYRDRDALLMAARELENELHSSRLRRSSLLHWSVLDPDGIAAERGVKMDLAMHRKRLEELIAYVERVIRQEKAEKAGRTNGIRRRSQLLFDHALDRFTSEKIITYDGTNSNKASDDNAGNTQSEHDAVRNGSDPASSSSSPSGPNLDATVQTYKRQLRDFLLLGSSNAAAGEGAGSTWGFGRMRLLRTSRGLLGFGPGGSAEAAATPLDLVYLLHGCSVPLVLRRSGSGITNIGHVVVGEMFGLGVMYGEFWKTRSQGEVKMDGGAVKGAADEELILDGWLDSLGAEEELELL